MVLSESDFGHQALSDIIPLRDIFGLLFFTTVGMLLDLDFLAYNWDKVAMLALFVGVGKGIIFGGLARLFKYINIVPIAVGMSLFQIGEFSFVLARVGLETGAISKDLYSLVLAAAVVSMIATPLVSGLTTRVYFFKKSLTKNEPLLIANLSEEGLRNHVVIAGGGRVGQHIAEVLTHLQLPFVLIELNHQRKEECKTRKYPVIFGDVSQETVLEAANISQAKLLLITTPSIIVAETLVRKAHRLQPNLNIVARAMGVEQMAQLYKKGVQTVILPELEAGLEIARQALLYLEIQTTSIQRYTDMVRHQMYAPIYNTFSDYRIVTLFENAKNLLEMTWTTIPQESLIIGKSIKEIDVRRLTGASIVGIIHEEEFTSNPAADYYFCAGDMVALIGNQEARRAFDQMTFETTQLL